MISLKQIQNCLQYIDGHAHLLDYRLEDRIEEVIISAKLNHVQRIIANTVKIQQFCQLAQLQLKYTGRVIAGFGIHPGWVGEQQLVQEKRDKQITTSWIESLQTVLNKNVGYLVGQIGLDFRKVVLAKNPKNIQIPYFTKQLQLSIKLNRPVTIHCVHAYGQMLKIFKKINKNIKLSYKPHFIMHSYGGSYQITLAMLKLTNLEIYFSLSLNRSIQLLDIIPKDKLICQTDSPYQNNVKLLKQYNRLEFNKYYFKMKQQCMNGVDKDKDVDKMETNQPSNVISNVKQIVKYYKIDQNSLTKIIYENSVKAFKLEKLL